MLPFIFGVVPPARDPRRQAALEAYEDQILGLLLDQDLKRSPAGSPARQVARARTLAALRRVGGEQKRGVVEFLHDCGLITAGRAVVDLRNADLRCADMAG